MKPIYLEEGRSPSTVEKYLHDAEKFVHWLGGEQVSKQSVLAWKLELLSHNPAPATVNAKLCAVNSLLPGKLLNYAQKQKTPPSARLSTRSEVVLFSKY